MSVIDADGHIIEPEGMFEHLPEEFHLRRPLPVRLPADTVRGDFNGCWLIEGKSVPNIGSRGRTTASISWTERSKKTTSPLVRRLWKTWKLGCPTWIGSTSIAR